MMAQLPIHLLGEMSRLMRLAKAMRPMMLAQQQTMIARPAMMRPAVSMNILSKSFGSDAHGGKDEVNQ